MPDLAAVEGTGVSTRATFPANGKYGRAANLGIPNTVRPSPWKRSVSYAW